MNFFPFVIQHMQSQPRNIENKVSTISSSFFLFGIMHFDRFSPPFPPPPSHTCRGSRRRRQKRKSTSGSSTARAGD
jgi:hypothetical protein